MYRSRGDKMRSFAKYFLFGMLAALWVLLVGFGILYLCRSGEQTTGVASLYAQLCGGMDALYALVGNVLRYCEKIREYDEKNVTTVLFFVFASKV